MKLKHLFVVASLLLFNGLSFSFASQDTDEPAAKRRKIVDISNDTAVDKTVQPNLLDMLPNEVLSQITNQLHIMVIAPLMLTEKTAKNRIRTTTKVFNASKNKLYLDKSHYNDTILLALIRLIFKFPNLTEINFQKYKTPSLFPFDPNQHLTLTKLNLSHNVFSKPLPSSISRLQNLKSLDLSHAGFSDFPAVICGLTGIIELDISHIYNVKSHNRKFKLPDIFSNLTTLQSLKMEGDCIESFPPSLSKFTNLTLLKLTPAEMITHFRNVSISSDFLSLLTGLTHLSLPRLANRVPLSFSTFMNLQVLIFPPDAPLSEKLHLPFSLTFLSGSLPPKINMDHWENLNEETLILEHLLPKNVQTLPNLRSLKITNSISSIPTDFTNLANLDTLELEIGEHTEKVFPSNITKLTNLQTLMLTMQTKKNLILGIGHLTMLTKLSLLNTISGLVRSLPEISGVELRNLTNLRKLNIENIYIQSLVSSNFVFPALEVLRLVSCALDSFPVGISMAQKNLRVLDLSHNNSYIMDHKLPEFFTGMTALETLTMVGCVLSSLTPGLENLTRLQFFDLRENCLDDDPHLIPFKQRVKILK